MNQTNQFKRKKRRKFGAIKMPVLIQKKTYRIPIKTPKENQKPTKNQTLQHGYEHILLLYTHMNHLK